MVPSDPEVETVRAAGSPLPAKDQVVTYVAAATINIIGRSASLAPSSRKHILFGHLCNGHRTSRRTTDRSTAKSKFGFLSICPAGWAGLQKCQRAFAGLLRDERLRGLLGQLLGVPVEGRQNRCGRQRLGGRKPLRRALANLGGDVDALADLDSLSAIPVFGGTDGVFTGGGVDALAVLDSLSALPVFVGYEGLLTTGIDALADYDALSAVTTFFGTGDVSGAGGLAALAPGEDADPPNLATLH